MKLHFEIILFYILFMIIFIFDREITHLTHDLDDLSSSLHMKAHI